MHDIDDLILSILDEKPVDTKNIFDELAREKIVDVIANRKIELANAVNKKVCEDLIDESDFTYDKLIKLPGFKKTSINDVGTTFYHYKNKKVHVVRTGPYRNQSAVVTEKGKKDQRIHDSLSSLKRHLTEKLIESDSENN